MQWLNYRLYMHAIFLTLCTLPICTVSARRAPQERTTRHALLVAVNGYGDPKRHPTGAARDLDTLPDVKGIKEVLIRRWGFKEREIKILSTPEETTHKAIIAAFRKVLIEPTHAGENDVIFFHYSGHGSQVVDKQNPQELDQTLVPSDYDSKHDGSNDIRDKEIANLLKELRDRKPGSVFLSFDSCHSGTITRDGTRGKERGFERPLPPTVKKRRGYRDGGFVSSDEAVLWGYTVISACRSDQSDYQIRTEDNREMGSLSYALCHALNDASPATTYRDIFNRIQCIMQDRVPNQEPQIEGIADQRLFSSLIETPEPTIGIYTHAGNTYMEAGFLMGITPGTRIALYPRDTKNVSEAMPIGTAKVKSVDATRAVVIPALRTGIAARQLEGARGVVTYRRYTDQAVRVNISGIKNHPQKAQIMAALNKMLKGGLIETTTDPKRYDLRILPPLHAFSREVTMKRSEPGSLLWSVYAVSNGAIGSRITEAPTVQLRGANPMNANSLTLQHLDGSFLTIQQRDNTYVQALSNNDQLAFDIQRAVQRFALAHMLRNLKTQSGDGFTPVQMEIVLCKVKEETDADGNIKIRYDGDLPVSETTGVRRQIKMNDYFYLKVRNPGSDSVYLTILDQVADGKLSSLWPNREKLGDVSNEIPRGKELTPLTHPVTNEILLYRVTEPIGAETIWAIATEKPADFSSIMDPTTRGTTRGPALTADESPLGRLFRSNQAEVRSAPSDIDTGGFSLIAIPFKVIPASKASK